MSAFICSKKHIQTLAHYYIEFFYEPQDICDHNLLTIANILYKENVKSVNYRYNEKTIAGKWKTVDNGIVKDLQYIELYKLVQCLDYQSCETNTYLTSHAKSILQALETKCIVQLERVGVYLDEIHNHQQYYNAEWRI